MSKRCMGCMEYYGDEFEVCPHCGYAENTPPEEAVHMEPGTLLHDRYIVGKVLGFGGFGVTYIGWDGRLEQKVAIKEYLPSEFSTRMPGQSTITVFNGEKREQFQDGLEKFVDEAKRLARFQNEPGIVKIFDSFCENETAYIIMEFLDGETLTEKLAREGTIPEDEAVELLMPVMNSLQVVHEEGILHRDIAPDNIFFTKDGEVKLIDFGASRYATTSHSRSLTVIIKPGYSPEEQYRSRGDQGPYTDVYALAATLYKMMTGVTPPDAMERRASIENRKKEILENPHKLNKRITINRENAILNAMNVQIEDRTPDVISFMEELNADPPAKRRYGKIKQIDLYTWPLWLKILVPSVLAAVLIFGTLIATGVVKIGSLFSGLVVVPDGMVIVPDVEGKEKDSAIDSIEGAHLNAIAKGNVQSDYVQAGKIVLQTPVGGSYSDEYGIVGLTVSGGKGVEKAKDGQSTVPYVIWDTQEDAVAKLLEAGLAEPKIETKSDENIEAGRVISQDPEYGTKVPEGTQITIVVSTGPASFEMPDVVGQKIDTAKATLGTRGLAVTVKYEQSSSEKNTVVSQSVSAGEEVKKGDSVTLTVSSGSNKSSSSGAGSSSSSASSSRSPASAADSGNEPVSSSGDDGRGTVSDWVPADSVPSGAKIVEEKWKYDYTETTTSSNSSLSGWTRDDSKTRYEWVSTGSGTYTYAEFPSGYNTSDSYYRSYGKSSKSSSTSGDTRRDYGSSYRDGYIYWHWACEKGRDSGNWFIGGYYNETLYYNSGAYWGQATQWCSFRSGSQPSKYSSWETGHCGSWPGKCYYSEWYFELPVYSQSYTDYKKSYTYYFYKRSYDLWADHDPSGESGVSNVRHYVKYTR